jgi:tubulin-specific chaperone E
MTVIIMALSILAVRILLPPESQNSVLILIQILGRSSSKTAASFIRPSRAADSTQSFVEAVHQKYASGVTERRNVPALKSQIEISGKVVEEVGFDKIRRQLAQLHELKIVIVDGMRVAVAERGEKRIKEVCPKIVELDLSRNLFEYYDEIMNICRELEHLKVLRLK